VLEKLLLLVYYPASCGADPEVSGDQAVTNGESTVGEFYHFVTFVVEGGVDHGAGQGGGVDNEGEGKGCQADAREWGLLAQSWWLRIGMLK